MLTVGTEVVIAHNRAISIRIFEISESTNVRGHIGQGRQTEIDELDRYQQLDSCQFESYNRCEYC